MASTTSSPSIGIEETGFKKLPHNLHLISSGTFTNFPSCFNAGDKSSANGISDNAPFQDRVGKNSLYVFQDKLKNQRPNRPAQTF